MPNFESPLIFFIFVKSYMYFLCLSIFFLCIDFVVTISAHFTLMLTSFRSKIFLRGSPFTRVSVRMVYTLFVVSLYLPWSLESHLSSLVAIQLHLLQLQPMSPMLHIYHLLNKKLYKHIFGTCVLAIHNAVSLVMC
jgi:hypothetical protein